ncbi:MAG: hypothetical protein ABSA92_07795 [Candidatus Bathyarchaeia archaeon]
MSIVAFLLGACTQNIRLYDLEGAFESVSELQHICDSCNFLDIRDEIGNYTAKWK